MEVVLVIHLYRIVAIELVVLLQLIKEVTIAGGKSIVDTVETRKSESPVIMRGLNCIGSALKSQNELVQHGAVRHDVIRVRKVVVI